MVVKSFNLFCKNFLGVTEVLIKVLLLLTVSGGWGETLAIDHYKLNYIWNRTATALAARQLVCVTLSAELRIAC